MSAIVSSDRRALLAELSRQDVGVWCCAAPLAAQSSWRIGGPAALLIEPESIVQVGRVLAFAAAHRLPLVTIGQGSNLLFDDAGFDGIVLKVGARLGRVDIAGRRIRAEGGAWVPGLACRAMRAGLSGLEHIVGIPGSLGGLVLMNGGSQRRGIGDNIEQVRVVDRDGTLRELSRAECGFGYRRSALQGRGAVVVGVDLYAEPGERRQIRRAMLADLRERRGKFPRKEPNCGSVFLSTTAMHATVGPPGKIIEQAGLKGLRIGDAEVSRLHANFIVNRGRARSAEVLALIGQIRQTVYRQIGFDLRCEVRYVTPAGEVVPADRDLPPELMSG
ncbi:MAG: UDP-N-acetylmuramate dehydrogenase [Desulfuromonadales bacterium]|nr:UDP-N-acetylmuramate dehydrogenase [Desulfuromonadales bacterium]